MTILLTLLKILGIILLTVLILVLTLVLLLLFVPVRYRLEAHRKITEDKPVAVKIKITWLLHMLNAAFSYPEAACIRVRLFCFTVFCSNKEKQKKENVSPGGETEGKAARTVEETDKKEPSPPVEETNETAEEENPKKSAPKEEKSSIAATEEPFAEDSTNRLGRFREFLSKILSLLKNIQYTIAKICDKIKHIVNNIQYYVDVLKSETFSRTWTVCSGELRSLLRSIRPRKFTGSLRIGTGDPASTGQVLAVYGILYPLIGSHIEVIPDFDRQIVEGELFIKGRITAFRFLKTAWVVYFNRDFRRLIKLFKREAA